MLYFCREVERLRKENKKLLEEEYERMNELLRQERVQATNPTNQAFTDRPTKIKVKWSGEQQFTFTYLKT